MSRDRGGGYGEAIAGALPDAIQVADRWHLMENASAAFLDAVHSRKLVRQIVRGCRGDVFRVRRSSLDTYLPVLDAEWASGCRNSAELWRRLADRAFEDPCALLASGQHGVGVRTRCRRKA